MPVDVTGLLGGALGGAVVTSIVSPLVTQRVDRRQHRAAVLRGVAAVERARWGDAAWDDFGRAVGDLRSAALVAGANRELTERYLTFAQVARRASAEAIDLRGDPDTAGIPRPLADLVRLAAVRFVDHLWHPWRTRPLLRRRLRQLDRAQEEARDGLAHLRAPPVRWDADAIE